MMSADGQFKANRTVRNTQLGRKGLYLISGLINIVVLFLFASFQRAVRCTRCALCSFHSPFLRLLLSRCARDQSTVVCRCSLTLLWVNVYVCQPKWRAQTENSNTTRDWVKFDIIVNRIINMKNSCLLICSQCTNIQIRAAREFERLNIFSSQKQSSFRNVIFFLFYFISAESNAHQLCVCVSVTFCVTQHSHIWCEMKVNADTDTHSPNFPHRHTQSKSILGFMYMQVID